MHGRICQGCKYTLVLLLIKIVCFVQLTDIQSAMIQNIEKLQILILIISAQQFIWWNRTWRIVLKQALKPSDVTTSESNHRNSSASRFLWIFIYSAPSTTTVSWLWAFCTAQLPAESKQQLRVVFWTQASSVRPAGAFPHRHAAALPPELLLLQHKQPGQTTSGSRRGNSTAT